MLDSKGMEELISNINAGTGVVELAKDLPFCFGMGLVAIASSDSEKSYRESLLLAMKGMTQTTVPRSDSLFDELSRRLVNYMNDLQPAVLELIQHLIGAGTGQNESIEWLAKILHAEQFIGHEGVKTLCR